MVSSYAMSSLKFLNAKGIISGKENNNIDPKGKTTREEAVVLFMRTIHEFNPRLDGLIQKKEDSVVFEEDAEVGSLISEVTYELKNQGYRINSFKYKAQPNNQCLTVKPTSDAGYIQRECQLCSGHSFW